MSGAAVIIGASGGIGGAFRMLLEEEGAFDRVHGFARSFDGANYIDLLDEASIAGAAAQIAAGPAPTLVLVATGLLHDGGRGPEKALRDLDPQWLARTYAVNAIGPMLVGLSHPVQVAPMGSTVSDLVSIAALAAHEAELIANSPDPI